MEKNQVHPAYREGPLSRSESRPSITTSSDFVLQWGNRKRLRCMKQGVNNAITGSGPTHRESGRSDRRVVKSDLNMCVKDPSSQKITNNGCNGVGQSEGGGGSGYLNLRQRSAFPAHRILRNSENSIGMRGQGNGGVKGGLVSPDRGDKKSNNTTTTTTSSNNNHYYKNNTTSNNHHNDNRHNGGGSGSSETAQEGKKSSGGGEAVWPPKFVIALTNKEKEEDFLILKGSKLPQRPKKRAKFVQRTLNLVSPGTWLCDLSIERYEVREKKVTKKRPTGLKAMGNMESDSE